MTVPWPRRGAGPMSAPDTFRHGHCFLKMPRLGRYGAACGVGYHVQAFDTDPRRRRRGSCAEWVHEMRSDLGRLAAFAEFLQVGRVLAPRVARLVSRLRRW